MLVWQLMCFSSTSAHCGGIFENFGEVMIRFGCMWERLSVDHGLQLSEPSSCEFRRNCMLFDHRRHGPNRFGLVHLQWFSLLQSDVPSLSIYGCVDGTILQSFGEYGAYYGPFFGRIYGSVLDYGLENPPRPPATIYVSVDESARYVRNVGFWKLR